jgi:hypothetical protein
VLRRSLVFHLLRTRVEEGSRGSVVR